MLIRSEKNDENRANYLQNLPKLILKKLKVIDDFVNIPFFGHYFEIFIAIGIPMLATLTFLSLLGFHEDNLYSSVFNSSLVFGWNYFLYKKLNINLSVLMIPFWILGMAGFIVSLFFIFIS